MHAPPKLDYPIMTPAQLPSFDAFLFGIPTRYGNFPAQWKVRIISLWPVSSSPSKANSHWSFSRRFGMRLASFGLKAPWRASLPGCSSLRAHREAVKRPLSLAPSPRSPTTASASSLLATATPSVSLTSWTKPGGVRLLEFSPGS